MRCLSLGFLLGYLLRRKGYLEGKMIESAFYYCKKIDLVIQISKRKGETNRFLELIEPGGRLGVVLTRIENLDRIVDNGQVRILHAAFSCKK